MAEAALPRLADERLHEIAQTIIETQSVEIEQLHGLRAKLAGNATPLPMDDITMSAMMELMPDMGATAELAMQMDPVAQVSACCAADNPDLAFIDLTIPHHEMAITASEAVRARLSNDQVQVCAARVIAD